MQISCTLNPPAFQAGRERKTMKSPLSLALAAVLTTMSGVSLWAEDWTTTDGKVYQEVKVVKTEPDAITILYRDGGALVPLAKLPPDLQKRFNYDPAQAKAAAEARAEADAKNAKALQAEKEAADKQKALALAAAKAKAAQANPAPSKATSPPPTSPFDLNPDPNDPNHHTTDYPFHPDPH
jgi:hypothetical protein